MAEISHFLDDCGRLWKLQWRPEPESKRRIRICSPLRHHSAIGPRRGWPQMCGLWCNGQLGCDIGAHEAGGKAPTPAWRDWSAAFEGLTYLCREEMIVG